MSNKSSYKNRRWFPRLGTLATVAVLLLIFTTSAFAITYGEPDETDHPNVGSIVVKVPDQGLFQWCSGTLLAHNVFLTASHCTAPLDGLLSAYPGAEVLVTFDPTIREDGTFYTGIWYTNPSFNHFSGKGGQSDPGDVAVIVLEGDLSHIEPAQLPTAGLLDQLKDDHVLNDTRFTAVGYGTVRDTKKTGFQAILDNLDRNRVEQGFNALTTLG